MPARFLPLIAVLVALLPARTTAQEADPVRRTHSLEQARKALAAAEAEAVKQKWPVAIAIVDGSGHLVAFGRQDNTQLGSIEIALEKAKCSAFLRRH